MKKYWLFAYADYYPDGGMNDVRLKFNTAEEFKNNHGEVYDGFAVYELLDMETQKYCEFHSKESVVEWVEENIE